MIDLCIIGSGFGGAVMAARLGPVVKALKPNARVVLLERGIDPSGVLDPRSLGGPLNAQGNRFRHRMSAEYLSELTELYFDPLGSFSPGRSSLNVLTGKGLGGGSNVYDGVSLRAPAMVFDQQRDGRRLWPSPYSRAVLEPYYARAEAMLKVRRLAWTDATAPHWALATKRDAVFAEGCRRIGATALPLKVCTQDDANEGWWNEGQRFSGRQNLSMNYLKAALDAGVEIHSGCEVNELAPEGKGYRVIGTDHRTRATIDEPCRLVVVAAGALGSSGILLRSKPHFSESRAVDPFNELGKHLSANGDYGVTGVVGPQFSVEGHKGKPMSSFCPSYFGQHQFIVIPFYAAPLYLGVGTFTSVMRPKTPTAVGRGSTEEADGERDWGLTYKKRLSQFGSRFMTMGCLALDACEGEVRLPERGPKLEVVWRDTTAATEKRWSAAAEVMRRIYEALGGEMFLDSYRKDGTVSTSHPLGGCRMGERGGTAGVVDAFGEHLRNPNLFVMDSAVIPSALGVNPSLTIAAVAELVAERLVAGQGTTKLADRLA